MKKLKTLILILSCLFIVNWTTVNAAEVNHKLTYQGQLMNGVNPANGDYDIIIQAYTTEFGNVTWGDPSMHSVVVDNGVFTILDVDLGDDASLPNYELNGLDLYLEIQVRQGGGNPVYEVLSPRQKLTAVPYAKKLVNGRALSGQVYTFDGSEWLPADNNHTTYSAGAGISISGTTINNNITLLDDLSDASSSVQTSSLSVGTLFPNNTGSSNLAIGNNALLNNTDGSQNIAIGVSSLRSNISGEANVAVGRVALFNNETGSRNTVIGDTAGFNSNGDGNVYLGYQAGKNNAGDNELIIENSADSVTPLIGGNFASNKVVINGQLGIGIASATEKLHIKGNQAEKILVESTFSSGIAELKLTTNFSDVLDYLKVGKFGPTIGGTLAGVSLNDLSAINAGKGPLLLRTGSLQPLYFVTNDTVQMTLEGGGNLKLEKKLTAPDSGIADMKAYIYGSTSNLSGAINTARSSDGFTIVRQSAGHYRVTFDTAPGNVYVVNVNVVGPSPKFATINRLSGYFDVYIWELGATNVDAIFNFVVFKK